VAWAGAGRPGSATFIPLAIGFIVAVGWLVISLLITFPSAVYLSKWSSCGHQPVQVSNFAAADSYSLPGDPGYGPGFLSGYVCTEDEAIRNGYHRLK